MRIGLFGGTFNPIHIGHLIAAQSALEHFELAKVVFVPCAVPPHKDGGGLVDARHRLAMVQAAVEDDFRFEVSDVEVQRGGRSYTVDTASGFREGYPDAELCFIIGADTLSELRLWREIGRLLEMVRFVCLARPGTDVAGLQADPGRIGLPEPWPTTLLADVVEGRLVDISSSDIRYRIAEGMSIRYLVPAAVEMYIAEHSLYRM